MIAEMPDIHGIHGRRSSFFRGRSIRDGKALQAETMRAAHLASLGELAAGVAHGIRARKQQIQQFF